MPARTRIFDLHCDTLDRLAYYYLPPELREGAGGYEKFTEPPADGELGDMAEAPYALNLQGMAPYAWCQCFAVFVPDPLNVEQSLAFFERVSGSLALHAAAHPELLQVARSAGDIEGVVASGKTCALLTIEGGKLLAAAPDMVERVARAGVKMITLTWNGPNPLGSGHDTQAGLTELGRKRIAEMEAARIVVDVSHLNDPGFKDVRRIARRPFAASHSNSRSVCNVPRNLTDDQFCAIRDAGGIVGLNYYTNFVTEHGGEYTPEELFAHVDHWLSLGGEDVVALGSDFDGCDTPEWLSSCTQMEQLATLARERYGETQAEKLLWQNAHDFFLRNDRA